MFDSPIHYELNVVIGTNEEDIFFSSLQFMHVIMCMYALMPNRWRFIDGSMGKKGYEFV